MPRNCRFHLLLSASGWFHAFLVSSRLVSSRLVSSAALALALAACGGGGDSTVQTAPVKKTPPTETTRDCTAVPRPAGCPDPEPTRPAVPLPLDGLGDGFKQGAAMALREVADTAKVQVGGVDESRLPVQGLQLTISAPSRLPAQLFYSAKVANVIPSENGDNIAYSFSLYTPGRNTFTATLEQISVNPFENNIFSLEDNNAYTSVKGIESIATHLGEDWDYSILKASVPSVKDGNKDSTLYAELWTDLSSSGVSDTNYMVGGWWLLAPNNPVGDYHFGAIAKTHNFYRANGVKAGVIDTATYKGNAAGLHTSSGNGMVSIQRLLGKVTLTADFGTTAARGTIEGKIDNLTLDGESARGEILLPQATLTPTLDVREPLKKGG